MRSYRDRVLEVQGDNSGSALMWTYMQLGSCGENISIITACTGSEHARLADAVKKPTENI